MVNSYCDISLVVPVFTGQNSIEELIERTCRVLENLGRTYEIILVHDAGSAEAWDKIVTLQSSRPKTIRGFRLAKNYGQNAATLSGMSQARGKWIVTIDEDLQTPPEEIPNLLQKAETEKLDLVFGIPEKRQQSLARRLGSGIIKRFFKSIEGIDIGSSFRLISRSLTDRVAEPQTEHVFINQLYSWYTDRIGFVEVSHQARNAGKSGYRFSELIRISLRLLLFYSDFTLRWMVYFGITTSLVCFGIGVYYIYLKLMYGSSLGFTSLIVAVFFSTGIMVTCMSVLGLYIQRIFKNQLNRPVYSIEQKVDDY